MSLNSSLHLFRFTPAEVWPLFIQTSQCFPCPLSLSPFMPNQNGLSSPDPVIPVLWLPDDSKGKHFKFYTASRIPSPPNWGKMWFCWLTHKITLHGENDLLPILIITFHFLWAYWCYYIAIIPWLLLKRQQQKCLWMCVWEDVGMQVFLLQNKSKAFYHGLETATPADGQRKK